DRFVHFVSFLNPKEAEMTLFQLLKVIVRLLLDGHTVQLGELNFTPSKELRKEIENATFKDIFTIQ
ncbi:MAG: hypothetical protein LBK58_15695, partial [Prevotellaceae bacterium]|nr:hypothetical protein [Prevotellaceae bacterium]